MKVGIIGGGIAGLSTALALRKAGIDFHLFERNNEFKEIGAGIMLSTSTLKILDELDLGKTMLEQSNAIDTFCINNKLFKRVLRVPVKRMGYAIHRGKLIQILSSTLNVQQYTLNAKIEHIGQNESAISLKVNDIEYAFDVVIAADGIQSSMREKFLPLVKTRFTGQTMWRGIVNVKSIQGFNNSMHELWGNNKRFGIMHLGNGEYFWYAVVWAKVGGKDNPETIKQNLLDSFIDFDTIVHTLINATSKFIRTDLSDIAHNSYNWYNERIVFVGDSIHACTPHLSQGACQAIESAYTLSLCLKKYSTNFPLAFGTYQQLRFPKTNFIVNSSKHFGSFSHLRKAWQDNLLHGFLKIIPSAFLKYKFNKTTNLNYLKKVE